MHSARPRPAHPCRQPRRRAAPCPAPLTRPPAGTHGPAPFALPPPAVTFKFDSEGKIAEIYNEWDMWSMWSQLGEPCQAVMPGSVAGADALLALPTLDRMREACASPRRRRQSGALHLARCQGCPELQLLAPDPRSVAGAGPTAPRLDFHAVQRNRHQRLRRLAHRRLLVKHCLRKAAHAGRAFPSTLCSCGICQSQQVCPVPPSFISSPTACFTASQQNHERSCTSNMYHRRNLPAESSLNHPHNARPTL